MFVREYLIRIMYRSGNQMDFWTSKFSVSADGSLEWTVNKPTQNIRPLKIAYDIIKDIESIWVVDSRLRFKFRK